ncbi:RHS repeat domain-containing protein [Urbifossiella limnaea]|uniref:RHS repeat domain-containing protein n=1 Tax=Urbifossiella limnaea TaxID=2528023 RepID=UPI0011A63727|nr:RHS repeat-associated core domain-containing protein [Urbifossiella limnaea]
MTQSRTANAQNEITGIGSLTTPTYDANGNMTGDETGRRFVYDAWNRLVRVKNAGGTTLVSYSYDGRNRRVTRNDGATTDLYYSAAWQVVEEGVGGDVAARQVWSPVYVDALVLRDRDTDADGMPDDERLWVTQDANWNVTAVVDDSGVVAERFVYDPFGVATIYSPSYGAVRATSNYAWRYEHQGLWYDATSGLYDSRHRWYSPTLGRFVSLDPIKYSSGDINLFRFSANSPITHLDPTGLTTIDDVEALWEEFLDSSNQHVYDMLLDAILLLDVPIPPQQLRGALARMKNSLFEITTQHPDNQYYGFIAAFNWIIYKNEMEIRWLLFPGMAASLSELSRIYVGSTCSDCDAIAKATNSKIRELGHDNPAVREAAQASIRSDIDLFLMSGNRTGMNCLIRTLLQALGSATSPEVARRLRALTRGPSFYTPTPTPLPPGDRGVPIF